MSGYVKIYGSIIRSTVWQQPAPTKLVWLTMLILADSKGIVESSIPGLAATAGVSLPECEAALDTFLSPDRYSHSKADEGRRIRPVDGGWLIINHALYRERRTEKQIADAERLATRRNATCRNVATDPDPDPDPDPNSDPDPEADLGAAPVPVGKPKRAKPRTSVPQYLDPNAATLRVEREENASIEREWPQFFDHHTQRATLSADWQASLRYWLRNAKTYSRGRHGPANGHSDLDSRLQAQANRIEMLKAQEANNAKK